MGAPVNAKSSSGYGSRRSKHTCTVSRVGGGSAYHGDNDKRTSNLPFKVLDDCTCPRACNSSIQTEAEAADGSELGWLLSEREVL